ncbi:MAG TPA: exodeoxyribonuclease I [Candidatus Saccharimonadales bacterium]|jgi:exodeoxyribonuclease-1|nr:exodeoxyribonuclease I [Candidatus Saccharimonadales bacterium]
MQPASFFFYDLETSGFSSSAARIMQFAGQRTDLNLQPIGEPVNVLIRMNDDVLPDPDAVLLTGITPQATIADGVTEVEFLKLFTESVATPNTIMLGYNTVRFDDEFMRHLHYRNFYDPYEWQWQDGRSKWDLLDLVRITRALRPDGIQWPVDVNGKPTNRLELLTALNKLAHEHAHDAMSDVEASIEVARLIRNKNEKLFDYLLSMRDKKKVAELATAGQPFVYTSGQYPSEFDKTTVVATVCAHPKKQAALVFDLRHDPAQYADKTAEQLAELWRWKKDATEPRLPVKTLQYNHCPAVAPLGVLDAKSQEHIKIDLDQIKRHHAALKQQTDLADRLCKACEILDKKMQTSFLSDERDVDSQLYDGFFEYGDKQVMRVIRAAAPSELGEDIQKQFTDPRLKAMLPLYKARNFAKQLTSEERASWERYRTHKLMNGGQRSQLAKYLARLQEIMARDNLTPHQEYLIEELRLYAESIMPSDEGQDA